MRATVLTLALLLSSLRVAAAHPLAPMVLTVDVDARGEGEMTWKVPLARTAAAPQPSIPARCTQAGASRGEQRPDALVTHVPLRCGALEGDEIAVHGWNDSSSRVFVRVAREGGTVVTAWLSAGSPSFTIPPDQSAWDGMVRYVWLGVVHLAEGVDHQLFVLGLVLLIGWRRSLIAAISAFTLGHSVALVAAYLGWIALNEAWVEVGIALTIVALASHIGAPGGRRSLLQRSSALMSGAFGLLHGLGFASVLLDIGLPPDRWVEALASFNVGIELGQLAGVGVLFALHAALKACRPAWIPRGDSWSYALAGYAIGTIAAYWTLQRTLAAAIG